MLAFGAVYPWAAPPLLALALVALWLARATPSRRDLLDVAPLAAVAIIAFQLMPLPVSVLDVLAPEHRAYRAAMSLGYDARAWAPLSLDPRATRTGLMLAAAALALFSATRQLAEHERRTAARWIAWLAAIVSLLGLGSGMLFPGGRIYGFWQPLEPSAQPFGVIINRNHFAAWAMIAAALAAGGLATHAARRRAHTPAARALVEALSDTRALWLLFPAVVAIAAAVATGSRSALAGLLAAGLVAALLVRRRAGRAARRVAIAAAALCLIAAFNWSRPDVLMSRLDRTGGELGLRSAIWQESIGIAQRYPITGVGAGAFPAAMAHYQRATRDVFFNHAHNQYLEIAAEGGLLLGLPLLLFAGALAWRIARRLRAPAGSAFWLRAGAAAALAGLAVLCIWESPFRTPATLMLAAVAAGLAAGRD